MTDAHSGLFGAGERSMHARTKHMQVLTTLIAIRRICGSPGYVRTIDAVRR